MCEKHRSEDVQKARPRVVMSRRTLLRGSFTTLGLAAGGVLFSGNPAQALDIYNPFSGYQITGTWQDHLDSGSLGGIDYGMGVGTALPPRAPESSRTFRTTAPADTR